jgi:hypothetical protein
MKGYVAIFAEPGPGELSTGEVIGFRPYGTHELPEWDHGFTDQTRKRVAKDREHRKAVRRQKRHLRAIKSKTERRRIRQLGRNG